MRHRRFAHTRRAMLALGGLGVVVTALVAGCQQVTYTTAPVPDPSKYLVSGAQVSTQGSITLGPRGISEVLVSPTDTTVGTVKAVIEGCVPVTAEAAGFMTRRVMALTGGTLTYGRYTLVIPPGALKEDADITISVSGAQLVGCDLGISPASLNGFLVPVLLTMDTQATSAAPFNPADLKIWWDSGSGWMNIGCTRDPSGGWVRSSLTHFSTYRAGW